MKASVASGLLLILLAILVTVNALYVGHITSRLTDMVNALPDEPDGDTPARIAEISDYLAAHETALGFSISYTLIDRIFELTETLEMHARCGVSADYIAVRANLLHAIDDAGRLERPAVKNIF